MTSRDLLLVLLLLPILEVEFQIAPGVRPRFLGKPVEGATDPRLEGSHQVHAALDIGCPHTSYVVHDSVEVRDPPGLINSDEVVALAVDTLAVGPHGAKPPHRPVGELDIGRDGLGLLRYERHQVRLVCILTSLYTS